MGAGVEAAPALRDLAGAGRRAETTYEALRNVSPLLGSRSGLNTSEEPMADVAAKLAELVAI